MDKNKKSNDEMRHLVYEPRQERNETRETRKMLS